MKKIILSLVFLFSFSQWANASNNFCREISGQLKSGDLVFLGINNIFMQNINKATNTWTNHAGIAFLTEEGWVVSESHIPFSSHTPLCHYLKRAIPGQAAILRLKQKLSKKDLDALWDATEAKMGILYNFGFNLHSKFQFCSKFIYEIFNEALGVHLGEIQTFKELLSENPEGGLTFWKFWFFGKIPWDRETITPKSQLDDPQLKTVWTWEDL